MRTAPSFRVSKVLVQKFLEYFSAMFFGPCTLVMPNAKCQVTDDSNHNAQFSFRFDATFKIIQQSQQELP